MKQLILLLSFLPLFTYAQTHSVIIEAELMAPLCQEFMTLYPKVEIGLHAANAPTFILGSALAGAAGVMFALRAPASVTMGFVAGLKGFTAAVIGGIGSIPGAMGGGFILGLAEAYTQGYISSKWSDFLVFVILIGFMLFRPQGLFGKKDINKV